MSRPAGWSTFMRQSHTSRCALQLSVFEEATSSVLLLQVADLTCQAAESTADGKQHTNLNAHLQASKAECVCSCASTIHMPSIADRTNCTAVERIASSTYCCTAFGCHDVCMPSWSLASSITVTLSTCRAASVAGPLRPYKSTCIVLFMSADNTTQPHDAW